MSIPGCHAPNRAQTMAANRMASFSNCGYAAIISTLPADFGAPSWITYTSRSLTHTNGAEWDNSRSGVDVCRIAGSQLGSQRRQILSDARPRPASIGAAKQPVRPHPAPSRDGQKGAFWAAGRGFESCQARPSNTQASGQFRLPVADHHEAFWRFRARSSYVK